MAHHREERDTTIQTPMTLRTHVLVGPALLRHAETAAGLRHRTCFERLWDYLTGPRLDHVLILYGLAETGKATLIRQAILAMDEAMRAKSALIALGPDDSMADVNADLKVLRDADYAYVFIDEPTIVADFIEDAAILSDVFAASGMRVVLTGTDSLAFLLVKRQQLYDRTVMLHTTHISYREAHEVLGIDSLDDYLHHGGTMSAGGEGHHGSFPFANATSTSDYVTSAIAHNIEHSLAHDHDGGHFRTLRDLRDAHDLATTISHLVEVHNQRFATDVLTRALASHDLGLGLDARRLGSALDELSDALTRIDDPAHAKEIRAYLDLLDLTQRVDVLDLADPGANRAHTIVVQPGLRWAQADALTTKLLHDYDLSPVSSSEKGHMLELIREKLTDCMAEDTVLLSTKLAYPKLQVSKLLFPDSTTGMVVADPEQLTCEIFVVRDSDRCDSAHHRSLVDRTICATIAFHFGPITRKVVLYRGVAHEEDGVSFENVEAYLLSLPHVV